jgi:hypothetical protein
MSTTTLCAWCLHDAGQVPDERDSHGICDRHAQEMMRVADENRRARQAREKKKQVSHV